MKQNIVVNFGIHFFYKQHQYMFVYIILCKNICYQNNQSTFGTVNSTVSGHWQLRILEKHIWCFPNDIVNRYFYYPVIFPNLVAALNLMLAVETWLTEVVITKRLTAHPFPRKCKYQTIVYMPLLKTSIWSQFV